MWADENFTQIDSHNRKQWVKTRKFSLLNSFLTGCHVLSRKGFTLQFGDLKSVFFFLSWKNFPFCRFIIESMGRVGKFPFFQEGKIVGKTFFPPLPSQLSFDVYTIDFGWWSGEKSEKKEKLITQHEKRVFARLFSALPVDPLENTVTSDEERRRGNFSGDNKIIFHSINELFSLGRGNENCQKMHTRSLSNNNNNNLCSSTGLIDEVDRSDEVIVCRWQGEKT